MDVTVFLSQLWGPVLLSVAIGVFVSRSYYLRIYRELEKEALTVLMFGMTAIAAGIAQITFHNAWDTLPQILVSFLGWALLLKGLVLVIVPGWADRAGDAWANLKLIPLAGGLMLIFGAYLTWVGYFGGAM